MASHASLETLIGLAKNQMEAAYRQIQQLMNDRRDAERQLQALQSYRHDYALRLQSASEGGLSASNYHNFRRFIATLDDAITQQNKVMAQIESRLLGGRQEWNAQKRRLNSYETLLERDARAQKYRENRDEQRSSDEIAMNLARRPFRGGQTAQD
jgi:flagellar FliJ protein